MSLLSALHKSGRTLLWHTALHTKLWELPNIHIDFSVSVNSLPLSMIDPALQKSQLSYTRLNLKQPTY